MRFALFIALALSCTSLFAETKQHSDTPQVEDEFSWQIIFDLSITNNTSIIVGSHDSPRFSFPLFIDLYYKGFFIQSNSGHFSSYTDNFSLGYELIVKDNYQVDFITRSYLDGFGEGGIGYIEDDFPEELKGIKTRKADASEGFRFTYYHKEGVVWFDLVADLVNQAHGGWIFDSYYSRSLPYRNWDIYLGGGVTLYSGEFSDYYYGVDPEEVLDSRPAYQAGSSYRVQFEAVAQHPLSESWLFATGFHLSHHSSAIAKSPLVKRHNNMQLILDFRYVF